MVVELNCAKVCVLVRVRLLCVAWQFSEPKCRLGARVCVCVVCVRVRLEEYCADVGEVIDLTEPKFVFPCFPLAISQEFLGKGGRDGCNTEVLRLFHDICIS